MGHTLLVTGGTGYIGSVLMNELVEFHRDSLGKTSGSPQPLTRSKTKTRTLPGDPANPGLESFSKIILVDKSCNEEFRSLISEAHENISVQFYEGDVCDYSSIERAFVGVDVVIHMASFGMSGREMLHSETIWSVNKLGTENVIQACKKFGVQALIFTSTVNVVYGGQRIESGEESMPYFDVKKRPWDHYANSKMAAEKAVFQANGELRTCALRLAGIYGPNERRHFPRIVGLMKQGLFSVTIGDHPMVDFVHSKNVTQCLRIAATKLLEPDSPLAGEAFNITDGAPVDNFEFFRPLCQALNVSYPRVNLPLWFVYYFAFLIEMIYHLVHRVYDFQPLLSRAEVLKTAQTHHFSIEKARNFLGYTPKYQNDLSTVITQYSATKSTIEHSSTSERSEVSTTAQVLPKKKSVMCEVCTQILVPMAAQALPKKKSIVYEVCTQIFLIVICVLLIMAFLPLVTT